MTYNLGQAVQLSTTVTNSSGTATDATVTLTVTKPDGSTTLPGVSHDGTGLYSATFTVDQAGTWWWRWDATGAVLDNDRGQITVADPKPPAYASLADLKASMTITAADRDDRLTKALLSASRSIDRGCGNRRFWLDAVATPRVLNPRYRTVSAPDGEKLLIDDIGTLADLVVEVGSGDSWTAVTDYDTLPDNALDLGMPVTALLRAYNCWQYTPTQRVRITAHWGWPAVPDDIVEATLILANRLYKRKDSPQGVLGSAEWGTVRISRTDPDVAALIAPFDAGGTG